MTSASADAAEGLGSELGATTGWVEGIVLGALSRAFHYRC